MTAPIEPTPGAPVDPAQPPTPANQPAPDPAPAPTEDIASLPEWAQKAIRDARSEAAKSRTTAKQNAANEAREELTKQLAKALGLSQDEPVDPAELTAQIEQAQAVAFRSAVETNMYRLGAKVGGDVEAMLDSNRFMDDFIDELDAHEDVGEMDTRSREFAEVVEKAMAAALERNPRFKANGQAPAGPTAPRPDPSQGPRGAQPQRFSGGLSDAIRAHYANK